VSRFASPLALAALLALGLGQNAPGHAATAPVTIEPGTIVEWVNRDQTIHNIVLTTARVASPGMDTGDHYTYQFNQPGDYPYLCALHPHMTGVVHVKPRA
jgi:plastocyanin